MVKKENEKFADSNIFEGITSVSALLSVYESGFNNRRIQKLLFDKDKVKSKDKEYRFLSSMSKKYGFPIELVTAESIDSLCIGTSHGGVAAYCTDRILPGIDELKAILYDSKFAVILEGIEDPYNFGYSLRSLYAFGVDCVILPERNWMTAAGVVARASAGTSEKLRLVSCELTAAAELLHSSGFRVAAGEIRDSVPAPDADLSFPLALIIGGERRGISKALLSHSDFSVRIEYGRNFGASLSAASASAILAYEVMRQNRN